MRRAVKEKRSGALLARLDGVARHSKDVDLYFAERAVAGEEAVGALAAAADRDLGDHFRFEITRTTPLQEAAKGPTTRCGGLPRCALRSLPCRRRGLTPR